MIGDIEILIVVAIAVVTAVVCAKYFFSGDWERDERELDDEKD